MNPPSRAHAPAPSNRGFPTAKITNSFLRFRLTRARSYGSSGGRNSRNFVSPALANSFEIRNSTFVISLPAMIISRSAAETQRAGFEIAARAKIRDVFGLTGDLG